MAGIRLSTFGGIAPGINPRLLPDQAAQEAANVELTSGTIEALRADVSVGAVSGVDADTKTIFRLEANKWATSDAELDFARSPVSEDQWSRVYWSGDSFPKMAPLSVASAGMGPWPNGFYRLGIPRPSANVTTSVSGVANDGAVATERAYIFTYVSAYGEEGPPSVADLADIILVAEGQTVTVTFPSNPSGNYNLITKRVYRSDPDGVFRFVADVPIGNATYDDSTLDANLGEQVPSLDWDAPPDDDSAAHTGGPLLGLTMLADGSAAGFSGKTLCFSEQNLPHAFPDRFKHALDDDIVGLVETRQALVVVTVGKPYIVYGTSPDARTPEQIDDPRGCTSKRSLVDMGEYALYATSEGILMAGGSEKAQNVTEGIITPTQWRAGYAPESIHAYFWEGKYVAFYDDGAGNAGGFILDPRGGESAFVPLDFYAQCGQYDRAEGVLYLVIGGALVKFARAAGRRSGTWKSKVFRLNRPTCPGAAKVVSSVYPVTMKMWADGVLKHTESVQNADFFRLPGGYKALEFEVELSGVGGRIDEVAFAESPSELF